MYYPHTCVQPVLYFCATRHLSVFGPSKLQRDLLNFSYSVTCGRSRTKDVIGCAPAVETWSCIGWSANATSHYLICTYGYKLGNCSNLQCLPSQKVLNPRNCHVLRDCRSPGLQSPKEITVRGAAKSSKDGITWDAQCHRINSQIYHQVCQQSQSIFFYTSLCWECWHLIGALSKLQTHYLQMHLWGMMKQEIEVDMDHILNYKYMMNIMKVSDNTRLVTSNLTI